MSDKSHLIKKRRERGEVNNNDLLLFDQYGENDLLYYLNSDKAFERTCAAIKLKKHKKMKVIQKLCLQLTLEKKLYTRIAISEALASFRESSIDPVINLLGKIGNNQAVKIPNKGFYKISYPLPRDIAARVLCRIGTTAIVPLENFMFSSKNNKSISEAIDAYGHIIYSNRVKRSTIMLKNLVQKHYSNELLRFKIIRCCCGFRDDWVRTFLLDIINRERSKIRLEVLRSLLLSGVEIDEEIKRTFSPEMYKLHLFLIERIKK